MFDMASQPLVWTDAILESSEHHAESGRSKRVCTGLGDVTECGQWSVPLSQPKESHSSYNSESYGNGKDNILLQSLNLGAVHHDCSQLDVQWPSATSNNSNYRLDNISSRQPSVQGQASYETVQNLTWPSPDNVSHTIYPSINATTRSHISAASILVGGVPSSAENVQVSSHSGNPEGEVSEHGRSSDVGPMDLVTADQDLVLHHSDNEDPLASENEQGSTNQQPNEFECDLCLGMVRQKRFLA